MKKHTGTRPTDLSQGRSRSPVWSDEYGSRNAFLERSHPCTVSDEITMRVNRLSKFTLIAAIAFGCVADTESEGPLAPSLTALTSAGSSVVSEVNGSAQFLASPPDVPPPQDLDIHVTINAQLLDDGSVRGSAHAFFNRPDGTFVFQFREDVTCLSFDGSTAWIGTVVVAERLPEGEPSRLGRPVVWQVEDGGVGQDRLQRLIDLPD